MAVYSLGTGRPKQPTVLCSGGAVTSTFLTLMPSSLSVLCLQGARVAHIGLH